MANAVDATRAEARRRFGDFVLSRVNPGSRFRNRKGLPLDFELFAEASEIGLLQLSLPSEIGGGGRDKFDWGVTIVELARMCADPGFPVLLDITVENTELLLASGRQDLIAEYVPDLVAGRRYAVQAAYESRDPYDYETTARLSDGEWVLNGAKRFVAGAAFANVFIVYLRDEVSNDMLAFLVERDDPGVEPVSLDSMGLRSMGFGQLVLRDVRLPDSRLIWRADALSELNGYARGRRLMTACGVVGAMEGIVERCVRSLTQRIRGGRRVLDYPNVERSVGEMRVLVESARSIVFRALDNARRPDRDPHFDELATAAKQQVSECALRVGQLVMNLQGGESYMTSFGWEQFMRDILGLIGGQGSQELLLIQLGQRSIVNLEGSDLRERAAQRNLGKLADAWWAASAALVPEGVVADRPELTGPLAEIRAAAGLESALDPGSRAEVAALLDHAASASTLPTAPPLLRTAGSGLSGPLADIVRRASAFAACAAAIRTGILLEFTQPCTVTEAASNVGLPVEHAERLVRHLVPARILREVAEGRYRTDPGLDPVVIGGPRRAAVLDRFDRTFTGAAGLRAAGPTVGDDTASPGCGADAATLMDMTAGSLLGRLEGLDALLCAGQVRVGCAAADGGQSAAALARYFPTASVVPIDAHADVREEAALVWLPAAARTEDELAARIDAATRASLPGGWVLVLTPLPPKDALGAAVHRLERALVGADAISGDDIQRLLRRAGQSHVRRLWADSDLGLQLIAGRAGASVPVLT